MNHNNDLILKSKECIKKLCVDIKERCVGTEGNREASAFFENELIHCGWETEKQEFIAIDWINGGATLKADGVYFDVKVSPYSLGCSIKAELVHASTADQLEKLNCRDKILFLNGEIAKEQLMPKNFVFYNPQEHQRVISLLENSGTLAIICATGRNSALAGGVYPFPLIEDGDFDIPSVYMTDEEGAKLIQFIGKNVYLQSISKRISGNGFNVIGKKGCQGADRILITAHIDSKKGTPGAIDNGTGVTVLLLLADLLKDYTGPYQIELVALNGEDYYAVPGQMKYLQANDGIMNSIKCNINIDGAGYKEGGSAFSFFDLPQDLTSKALETINKYHHIKEGIQWPQGDHSIFVQYGRPAIAVTSQWFLDNIESQTITHTPKDNPDIIDYQRLIELAFAIRDLVLKI
ncbi:MAG TPA: M28 family peptidase [Chitinispirillaceae bacterium]|nr:M28 family peptidase [Chitinispirillaceae bacterium]